MMHGWFSGQTWRMASIVALSLLVVALVVLPALGLGQGGQDPNSAVVAEEGTPLGRTDDPLGRVQIPVAAQVPPDSNAGTAGAAAADGLVVGDEAAALEQEILGIQSYSSPLVIPGADFASDGLNPDSYFFWFGGGRIEGGESSTCLMAPAHLPGGVTVGSMFVSYIDNDPAQYLFVRLYRVNNYDGTVNQMADVTTTDAAASTSLLTGGDSAIDFPLVSYPSYSYYVGTCLPSSSLQLYSVRLYYGQ